MLIDSSCHAAATVDAVLPIVLFRAAGLDMQMMLGSNFAKAFCNPLLLLL